MAELCDPRDDGVHAREETVTTDTSEREVVTDTPFAEAVMTAVWLAVMVPEVAVKVAEVLPEPISTDPGTVRKALLSVRATVTPPDGATPLRRTVHVDWASDPREVGLQLNCVRPEPVTVTVPPVAWMEIGLAVGEAPSGLVTPIVAPVALADVVTVTTATTPF